MTKKEAQRYFLKAESEEQTSPDGCSWPTAFWVASIWFSIAWMVYSVSQCTAAIK